MAARNVRVNISEVEKTLRSRTGPVVPTMNQIQRKVLDRARDLAPKKTGRLAQSLQAKKPVPLGKEIVWFVGSELPYAFWTDQGSDPHIIVGKPRLVFVWPKITGSGFGPAKNVFITPSHRWKKGFVMNPGISLNPAAGNKGATQWLTQARDEVVEQELRRFQ